MKNTNGDMVLDCWACAHSQTGVWLPSQERWLVCSLTLLNATERCERFEYCPGTDQGERIAAP